MASTNGLPDGHVEAIKQEAEQKGVPMHSFDPDASPQEKAAAAGKHASKLGNDKISSTNPGGQEVKLEQGTSSVVPTITVEHADDGEKKFVSADTNQTVEESDVKDVPGAMPAGSAPQIPDWYRVGWRQVSGIDDIPDDQAKDKGVLDTFLSEQFYGSWYHNAGIIIFAVFSSHFLTRFGFGWGWLFIILAVCSTYYSTSIERVRRRARDDIQRDLVKTRLTSEHESAEWMNNFLDRFWKIYEPVLSKTIIASVDQILSVNTPPFLDALRLTDFTLGTKAPHIDKVRTFPSTADDVVMMDWGFSFTPNDISDLTPKQLVGKQNPKIILNVRVGKGLAAAGIPILVEDINFSGLMRIRMKLVPNFPHIQIVDISFLEKPVIDYVLKPIGGETFGFDIANIPGLSSFIRDMTHATLGPMMYDPNVFTLNLEQMLSGKPLDAAIGVLQVTIQSARGIKGTKIGGGTPDPFVALTINDRAELAKTKYKHNTYNPTWMETKFILINNLSETLLLKLWDYNDHRKNSLLGDVTFELSKLVEDATHEDVVSTILRDGKERGELKYDVSYYPVLEAKEGQDAPDSSVGIVRLVIHQAKELDKSKTYSEQMKPFAKVFVNGAKKPGFSTRKTKYTMNPVWEEAYEFLCADKETAVITVKVVDDRELRSDPVVGYMSIKLTDLLDCREGETMRDWFPLSGCKTGKVRVSAEWKPLGMAGALQGADHYAPPIGVVRLVLDKATDVKNVEATLGGKSDPYVRVQVNNVTKARTEVVNNNLNPVWDQIVYIPVHSLKETLFLECMDYQHLTRDRSLGSVILNVADLAKESTNDRYRHESTGVKEAQAPLRQDKGGGFKGHLHYKAEFVPALALKDVKFDKHTSGLPKEDTEGEVADDGSSVSSSDLEDEHGEQVGITIQGTGSTASSPTTPRPPKPYAAEESSSADGESVHAVDENKDLEVYDVKPSESEGIEMSEDDLLSQQSGILIVNVVEGKISKKARLEVLLDDGYWPCFGTLKARSTNAVWEHVGEGFIKEIDFSRVWLRLNEADEGDKDDIIAEWKGDAKPFLQQTLKGLSTFTLTDEDQKSHSTITLEARYVPVPVQLEPRESINNQGVLRVDLLEGRDIHAADRSGKSDPYAVFTLDGQKVFKSQTKKKTLAPIWDETFTVSVPSRVGSSFSVEIFDWNQIEQAKSLGEARINLEDIEPFQAVERVVHLTSPKHGEKGEIQIRLLFQPEIIAKARKNTSTFSSAGRAVTQIGALPMSAGKGVLHGVTGVFKKDSDEDSGERANSNGHHHHKNPLHSVASVFKHKEKEPEPAVPPSLPTGQASQPVNAADTGASAGANVFAASNDGGAPQANGTLHVTILDGKDFGEGEAKPYVTVRCGDKETKTKHVGKTATPEWNESFKFTAGPMTPKLYLWVHDHKTLGKDKDLAEGEVDIWRHIAPGLGSTPVDVTVEVKPHGLLRLRLDFDASPANNSGASISSGEKILRTPSNIGVSSSRFSIGRRRASEAIERDD